MQQAALTFTQHFQKSYEGQHGPYTRHDFKAADGTRYSTTKPEIAQQAASLLNQPVEIQFSTKQNGQYTNHTLLAVTPVQGSIPLAPATAPQQSQKDAYWERREANDEARQRGIDNWAAIKMALKAVEIGLLEGVTPVTASSSDIKLAAQVFLQIKQELDGVQTPTAASPPSAPAEPAGLTPVGSQGDDSGIPY